MSAPNNTPKCAVVLFDIDGTLIRRAGPHHRQALEDAIRDVTGLPASTDGVPTAGMLDQDILAAMLSVAGASAEATAAAMPALIARAQSRYLEICPDLSGHTCPGSLDLMTRLRDEGIPMGLVTGNLTAIGWRKMESAGLRPYLTFGAFAEMGVTRAELAALAVEQACGFGWIGDDTVVSLIGDHMNDVEAARQNRIRSIAVCTGVIGRAALESAQPDRVYSDLTELPIEALLVP